MTNFSVNNFENILELCTVVYYYDDTMFVRVVKSNGYSYARLVESYHDRATGKTKQRVICNLFRLDPPDPKANALKAFFQHYLEFSGSA